MEPKTGRFRTQFEVDNDHEMEAAKKLKEAREKKKFYVRDDMINDWPGDRFLTASHGCFGGPCNKDSNLVQLDTQKHRRFAYGDAQKERDLEAGYPSHMRYDKELHDLARSHIDALTGRFITPWERALNFEAAEEARLNEAATKPAFKVKDEMINDWSGDRFLTPTHGCFGGPCEKKLQSLVQDDADIDPNKTKVFKMGDMQEHRYPY